MAKIKKSGGLTILYRTANIWNVFDEAVTPQELEGVVRNCKLSTISPWIWWGPPALAAWMVENPTVAEKDMPKSVQRLALKQMTVEQATLERGMDFVRAIVISLEQTIRPTKREVRQAQKAEASRRKK